MNTAAGRPGRRLKGRKAEAGAAEREREHEHGAVLVLAQRVERE